MGFSCLVLFLPFVALVAPVAMVPVGQSTCGDRPTCDASKAICESNTECKELLGTFTTACRRAMHHGHRKHCHVKCAKALDSLVRHSLGQALGTCDCAGEKNCAKQRRFLQKACTLRHGKRNCTECSDISCFVSFDGAHNPSQKKICSSAIFNCLLDSCCRKAYREFYYGPECQRVIAYPGFGPEPTCSEACVEKFDALAKSPHADDLFACDCADMGTICTRRYENYDKFCIDNRLRSSKHVGEEHPLSTKGSSDNTKSLDMVNTSTSLLTPPPCRKALETCLNDEQCSLAFKNWFFGECHRALVYIEDGPPPICPLTCEIKLLTLTNNPLGKEFGSCTCGPDDTLCTLLRNNREKYCKSQMSNIPDCTNVTAECLSDSKCGLVLRDYLYGPDCRNVLNHTDASATAPPKCSPSCIAKERELRKQPKAQQLLYCNCSPIGEICSRPRSNFNKYCNTCPEDYAKLIGDGATTDQSEHKNDCDSALKACIANKTCSKAYLAFYSGKPCRDVLFHTRGKPDPVCSTECITLEKTLRKIPEASSLIGDCNCGVLGPSCSIPRENFKRYCRKDCAREWAECKLDPTCNTVFNSFLHGAHCNNVLYASDSTAGTCSTECKELGKLVHNTKAYELLRCDCSRLGNSCCMIKQNFFKHCEVPHDKQDNSCPVTTPPSSQPSCAVAISKCQLNKECNQLLDGLLHADDCKNVLYYTGDGDHPICYPSCMYRHFELASHPMGKDLLQCDCGSLGPICSTPFHNLFKYCSVPRDDQQFSSGDYCEVHAQRCLQHSSCKSLFKEVSFGSKCLAIKTHVRSEKTTRIDCSDCNQDLEELKRHSHGFDMFGCTCNSLPCRRAQNQFKQICGLLPRCSDIRMTCTSDGECLKRFLAFTQGQASCDFILFPSGMDTTAVTPNCTLACLLAHSRLLSHSIAKHMVSCDCSGVVNNCSQPRMNFLNHCPVPDSPIYPHGKNGEIKCEAQVNRCLSHPNCSSRFAFDSIACDMVVRQATATMTTDAATMKPLCDRCVAHMTQLAAEPDGININTCSCETYICQLYQDKIREHCLQGDQPAPAK